MQTTMADKTRNECGSYARCGSLILSSDLGKNFNSMPAAFCIALGLGMVGRFLRHRMDYTFIQQRPTRAFLLFFKKTIQLLTKMLEGSE